MDEMQPHQWQIFDEKYAVVLNKATFRWDKEVMDKAEVKIKHDKKGHITFSFINFLYR